MDYTISSPFKGNKTIPLKGVISKVQKSMQESVKISSPRAQYAALASLEDLLKSVLFCQLGAKLVDFFLFRKTWLLEQSNVTCEVTLYCDKFLKKTTSTMHVYYILIDSRQSYPWRRK